MLRTIPYVVCRHLPIKPILGRLRQVPEVLLQVGIAVGVVVDLVEFVVISDQDIALDLVAIPELGREGRIFLLNVHYGALIYQPIVLCESESL